MATIRHKRSSTAGATPAANSLVAGELAVNTADGRVYLKKDDASVVCVAQEPNISNIGESSASSVLVGRRSGSVGPYGEVTLGSGLTMSGWELSATTTSSPADDDQPILAMRVFA